MDHRFIAQLIGVGALIEQQQTLEDGLRDIAAIAAHSLHAGRCSVMLVTPDDDAHRPALKVCSHYGDLPVAAYASTVAFDSGIAGHVATSGEALLINDVQASAFAALARRAGQAGENLMSVPIRIADRVIGVINVSQPVAGRPFLDQDLHLLEVFAMFIAKSIHVFELQRLSESRVRQMAQLLDERERGDVAAPISPDPARLAKMVAKNFYRELSLAGFGPNAIVTVASEVLGLLNESLGKHRSRLHRDDPPDGTSVASQ